MNLVTTRDTFGYHWHISLGQDAKDRCLVVLLNLSGIDIKLGASISWEEGCRSVNLTLFNLDFTLFLA